MSSQNLVIVLSMTLLSVVSTRVDADTSRWDGHDHARARLVSGGMIERSNGARLFRAGLELNIRPGWKMYWRYPGDAGVPPRFDFKDSKNVKNVEVRWPAPERVLDEGGANLIVYKGQLLMPLHVTPEDPTKPPTIVLKLDYGICQKVCILSEANLGLTLTRQTSGPIEKFTAAEARVPRPAALGENGLVSLRGVRREPGTAMQHLAVDLTAPADTNVDLIVEGPTTDWALPLPKLIANKAGNRRFVFGLDGAPPGLDPVGTTLRYTVILSSGQAIEVLAPIPTE